MPPQSKFHRLHQLIISGRYYVRPNTFCQEKDPYNVIKLVAKNYELI